MHCCSSVRISRCLRPLVLCNYVCECVPAAASLDQMRQNRPNQSNRACGHCCSHTPHSSRAAQLLFRIDFAHDTEALAATLPWRMTIGARAPSPNSCCQTYIAQCDLEVATASRAAACNTEGEAHSTARLAIVMARHGGRSMNACCVQLQSGTDRSQHLLTRFQFAKKFSASVTFYSGCRDRTKARLRK